SSVVHVFGEAFRPPIDPGSLNLVQHGQAVPVRIIIGCSEFLSGLHPSIAIRSGDYDPNVDADDSSYEVADSASNADTDGLMREQYGSVVVDLLRLDDDADLAAGLERVDLLDAVVPRRDLLERLETLDVLLQALAARARPRSRDRVRRDHQHRLDGLRLDLVVVRLDRVHDRG